MPFLFSYVCDLLQRLDENQRRRSGQRRSEDLIRDWFERHRRQIERCESTAIALLSTLLPETRTDRVYGLQVKTLNSIIARALGVDNTSRKLELERWLTPGHGVDLGDCVESILNKTPNGHADPNVMVEQVDNILHGIASLNRFSSPAVRSSARPQKKIVDREKELRELYQRVTPRDAKWLTRLILKDYQPVKFGINEVYRCYHPLLPVILKIQHDLGAALALLQDVRNFRAVTQGPLTKAELVEHLKPQVGVKVGRQHWLNGRSIKHCLKMGYGRMSVEKKYDGEFCQIHVDLSKGHNCIQIFSKNGKDSTRNLARLHDTIRTSLRIGQPDCVIERNCILEGEVLVYSDRDNRILSFDKLRKHVPRNGTFINVDMDSQAHEWEHLMIVFYDLLLLDGESFLGKKHSKRMSQLAQIVTCRIGQAQLVEREVIDFSRSSAAEQLRSAFARSIRAREEGLVLKPDSPYFDFSPTSEKYSACCIKLKKEYIKSFGDVGDFAVVGARYDAIKAKTYNIPNLRFTHFFVGCLQNKEEVVRWHRPPLFVLVNVVELSQTQLESFLRFSACDTVLFEENDLFEIQLDRGVDQGRRPSLVFKDPPIFDIRCFSFKKEGNTRFLSMRFPAVSKIHYDRSYTDAITFEELQEMARKETEAPPDDSQEMLHWAAALEDADNDNHDLNQMTQSTNRSIALTPSPRRLRQRHSVQVSPLASISESPMSALTQAAQVSASRNMATPRYPQTPLLQHRETEPSILQEFPSPDRQKRSHDGHIKCPRLVKRSRPTSPGSFAASMPSSQPCSSAHKSRDALGDITESSQTRDNATVGGERLLGGQSFIASSPTKDRSRHPQDAQDAPPYSSAATSFHMVSSITQSPLRSTLPSSLPARTHSSPAAAAQPRVEDQSQEYCRFYGRACELRTCYILLSPCVARIPWLTEDLLSAHGVTKIFTDPAQWVCDDDDQLSSSKPDTMPGQAPQRTSSSSALSSSVATASAPKKRRRRRARRIVLVEQRRRDATEAFLQQVGGYAYPTVESGARRWVEVYDWRLLEELTKDEMRRSRNGEKRAEMKRDTAHAAEVFRKYFVGLV